MLPPAPANPNPPDDGFKPFVPAGESPPEFTIAPIIVGSLLGLVFGASSMYMVLKVGLTVSASIPVAVLSFGLFKVMTAVFRGRKRSILETNISQTAGSAGESIAFAIGLVMPALLVIGFEIDVIRVMTVGILGGLLGILMMIPLRRAFIVNKHGELKYPEGTACADVLKAGEKGGTTAGTLVVGLLIGFVYQFLIVGLKVFKDVASVALSWKDAAGQTVGLKGASIGCEMSAPLLGVGYIIGPKIASVMVAGGILSALVLAPMVAYFGEKNEALLAPAESKIDEKTGEEKNLIRNLKPDKLRSFYVLYIGAGAVAAGGIISMVKALPVIITSVIAGFRDLTGGRKTGATGGPVPRTERDLPMWVVLAGSLGLIVALAAAPAFGLGLNLTGIAGACLILFFGFLFVTVSSRLTGEIGSSSNPISGMTVATLLLTCLILLALGDTSKEVKLIALTIAGVVCVASSNGGTTSQALKTGHLLGATPKFQQYAILIGSLTSAVAVGGVLILLNQVGTVYTKLPGELPDVTVDANKLPDKKERVQNGQYSSDPTEYKVLLVGKREKVDLSLIASGNGEAEKRALAEKLKGKRFLVRADGTLAYRCDPAVNGDRKYEDSQEDKPEDKRAKLQFKFDAPKTELVALIIDGIMDRDLPWDLVIIGALIAVVLELCGVSSLAFAVGVYLPVSASTPIFIGGMVRWLVDKLRRRPDEGDSSPGVLLTSGYIAGGAFATLMVAPLTFLPEQTAKMFNLSIPLWGTEEPESDLNLTIAFGVLTLILFAVSVLAGRGKKT